MWGGMKLDVVWGGMRLDLTEINKVWGVRVSVLSLTFLDGGFFTDTRVFTDMRVVYGKGWCCGFVGGEE